MKYICIKNKKYKVLKEYMKNYSSYVEYNDGTLPREIWELLGIIIHRKVMVNNIKSYEITRVNKWNPLTYIALIIEGIYTFMMEGLSGFRKKKFNPFKDVVGNCVWFVSEDIKIVEMENERNDKAFLWIMLTISIILNIYAAIFIRSNDTDHSDDTYVMEEEEGEPVAEIDMDKLSDWQMFTLALMKVESEYNPDAISSVGAQGYFQITPIYVEEVNRVWGTEYEYDDVVKSFELSYEVFDLMQKAHNPDYNMKKALELHNGKHEWYNRRVFSTMEELQKYENMRNKIKNI